MKKLVWWSFSSLWEQNFTCIESVLRTNQFLPFDLPVFSPSFLLQEIHKAWCHTQAFYNFTSSFFVCVIISQCRSSEFVKWCFLADHFHTIKWLSCVESVKSYLCFKAKIKFHRFCEIFLPLFHSDVTTDSMALGFVAVVPKPCWLDSTADHHSSWMMERVRASRSWSSKSCLPASTRVQALYFFSPLFK